MPVKRNKSEMLFDQYLTERGYAFESQPETPQGKTKKLEDRVSFDGSDVYFEVKEFQEVDAIPCGAFDPYRRIYSKLSNSRPQLYHYREYSCSLVLYNGSAAPVFLEPEFVLGAMLGTLTYVTYKGSELTHKVFGDPSGFKTGRMLNFNNMEPRNTYFSSVIVLEEFPLGQIKLFPVLDERKEHQRNELSTVESAVNAWNLIQTLKSEGFDCSEKVLRVVVYENPYANISLPRGLFQGPYDERWGTEEPGLLEFLAMTLLKFGRPWLPGWVTARLFRLHLRISKGGKITKVFEGSKLRVLRSEVAFESIIQGPCL